PCRSGSKGEAPWSPKAKYQIGKLAWAYIILCKRRNSKKSIVHANLLYDLGQFTISGLEFNIVRYYCFSSKSFAERVCDEK
ncbi:hypothetical protein, partial [Victivallis vadensis]|uniref:hypothetical protein n=1 Tax=Victivallis vadensis TaxID=172901 RepID=UPI00266D3BA5